MPQVLNVLLSHQTSEQLAPVLKFWDTTDASAMLLLAHGGSAHHYSQIRHEPKIFIEDRRLRTRDHQREYQSITELLKAVRRWIEATCCECDYVHIAEYDHLPLVPDLNARQITRIEAEGADLLAFHLQRIDGTSHPHYLYHSANPNFWQWRRSITRRSDSEVTLSMLGTGSFWRRTAFDAAVARDEPFPMYFEIYLPTLVHHLGFRIRDWAEQNPYVVSSGDRAGEIEGSRRAGAWTLHPVKTLPHWLDPDEDHARRA